MRKYRNLRVAGRINQELSLLFVRDFDFEGAIVTVTSVIVSEDLLHAVVKLGIIPPERGPDVFFLIERAKRTIQKKLKYLLNIRPMPKVSFLIDQDVIDR